MTPRTPLLERLGLHRPALRAWAMYDWANSAMVTVVVTAVFPVYFRRAVAAGDPSATTRFTIATTIALTLAALLGPVLGALGDVRPWKKRLLFAGQTLAVITTGALALCGPGDGTEALVLFALANIGASWAFVFYDALLPHVARDDEADRVSAAGYAIGYVGGGLALALVLAAILRPESFGLADRAAASRAGFVLVAVWWVVFSLPLYLRVPEPDVRRVPGEATSAPVRSAFARLAETARGLRSHPDALAMMIAFLLYNDGIATIIRMAALVGEERGFSETTLFGAILAVQFTGIPCSFAFGALAPRFGAKRLILAAIVVYAGVTVLAARMTTETEFWILALLVGVVQGGAQALSRSMFASLIPRRKASELFGVFGAFEKFAGILGPAAFTIALSAGAGMAGATLSILPFFAVGAWMLTRVDVDRGRTAARDAEHEPAPTP